MFAVAFVLIMVGVVVVLYILDPEGGRCGMVEGASLPCPGDPAADPLVVIGLTLIAVGVAKAVTALAGRKERKATVPGPKDGR